MTTITTTIDISLSKLTPSAANVRRTAAGAGIEALAASIEAHGLLQSLVVRPKPGKEGQATDRFGGPVATDPKLHFNSRTVTVCCREIDA